MRPHRISPFSAAIFFAALAPSLFAQAPVDDDGTLFFPPTLTVETKTLITRLADRFIDYTEEPGVFVDERITHDTLSLLPIIFFDAPGSLRIPERYKQFAGSFDAADYADTLPVIGGHAFDKYYQILDIIGYRMSLRSEASLTLLGGYTAEPDETPELATHRTEEIRDYLVRVWRIDPDRIELLPPEQLCGSDAPSPAREEARCVRIFSADPAVLAPVPTTIFRYYFNSLELQMGVDTHLEPEAVESIEIELAGEDSLLCVNRLADLSPSFFYKLTGKAWLPRSLFYTRPTRLTVGAKVRLKNGNVRLSDVVTIPVAYSSTIMSSIRTVTLPFFHYRDTTLNLHQRIMLNRILQDYSDGKVRYELQGGMEPSEAEQGAKRFADIEPATSDYPVAGNEAATLRLWEVDPEGKNPADESIYILPPPRIAGCRVKLFSHSLPASDSLIMARTGAVARYIRSRMPNAQIDPIISALNAGPGNYDPTNYPEHRYYNRTVVITAIRQQ